MNEQEKAIKRKQWALEKLFALKVIGLLGREQHLRLKIWQHEGEKRVSIYEGHSSPHGCQISYFPTGNAMHPPGLLVLLGWKDLPELRAKALQLCEQACKEWDAVEIDCDAVAQSNFQWQVGVNIGFVQPSAAYH